MVLLLSLARRESEGVMTSLACPTESQEGDILVAYLRVRGIAFTHVANETGHDDYAKRRAVRMKRQGTSKGFPDYVIALPPFGVLYIELKRIKGSRTSDEQWEWVKTLNKCAGTEAYVAFGAEQAIQCVEGIIGTMGGSDTLRAEVF